jgi:methylenetetrahydrofolate reductase (NADPH)
MHRARDLGLLENMFVLAGVGPLKSAKSAQWMRTHVAGTHIPDSVIARLSGAQDQAQEGRRLCIDLIHELRQMPGVSGVHVMAYRQEESVAEVIERSGVLGGRIPWFPERDQQQQPERIDS